MAIDNKYLKFQGSILVVVVVSLVICHVDCLPKPNQASHYCGIDFVKVWQAACLFKKKHNMLVKRNGKKFLDLFFYKSNSLIRFEVDQIIGFPLKLRLSG